jgi:hypothetical protein
MIGEIKTAETMKTMKTMTGEIKTRAMKAMTKVIKTAKITVIKMKMSGQIKIQIHKS